LWSYSDGVVFVCGAILTVWYCFVELF